MDISQTLPVCHSITLAAITLAGPASEFGRGSETTNRRFDRKMAILENSPAIYGLSLPTSF
jgi:hypothetical protein